MATKKELEEQCAALEKMDAEDVEALSAERDKWKERALKAEGRAETSKKKKLAAAPRALRHV